jgi:hypothetical protein
VTSELGKGTDLSPVEIPAEFEAPSPRTSPITDTHGRGSSSSTIAATVLDASEA